MIRAPKVNTFREYLEENSEVMSKTQSMEDVRMLYKEGKLDNLILEAEDMKLEIPVYNINEMGYILQEMKRSEFVASLKKAKAGTFKL